MGMCWHDTFATFKGATRAFKQGEDKICAVRRDMCYWETDFGYRPYKNDADMSSQVKDLLVKVVEEEAYRPNHRRRSDCSLMYRKMRIFLTNEWNLTTNLKTISQWV
jgi:hypothetical protein